MEKHKIPVLSFVAKSGTGKTTYLEKLIPALKKRGLRLAIIKHDAHEFEIDVPGKDSYRFAHAGTDQTILTSNTKTAVILNHANPIPLADILAGISDVDLILTEGYKHENMPKIEIYRQALNRPLLEISTERIALVCDAEIEVGVPKYDLEDFEGMVSFILDYIKEKGGGLNG